MPVIERQRKEPEEITDNSKKPSEKQAKAFVEEGTLSEKKKFVSFTLKIPESMAREIDEICQNQCGYISRRSWVVQAAAEKLEQIKEN